MKVTNWFPRGTKPLKSRKGVYETEHGFQYWDGAKFYGYATTAERAFEHAPGFSYGSNGYVSFYQKPKWRGLTRRTAKKSA